MREVSSCLHKFEISCRRHRLPNTIVCVSSSPELWSGRGIPWMKVSWSRHVAWWSPPVEISSMVDEKQLVDEKSLVVAQSLSTRSSQLAHSS